MSSAANHRKRSHRSEFRTRPYQGNSRQMVCTPTVNKRSFMQFIRLIRGALRRVSHAPRKTEADAV